MPTLSQAMIVITEKGDDPRVPRRHVSIATSTLPVMNIGNSDCKNKLPNPATNTVGFQNVVDIKGYRGTISYDAGSKSLRWLVTTQEKNSVLSENKPNPVSSFTENRTRQQPALKLPFTTREQEERKIQLENLGVRRRRLPVQTTGNKICSTTTLPKGAKYLPAPPGEKPRPFSNDNISSCLKPKQDSLGDTFASDYSIPRSVTKDRPKSLLDELKASVSYDKRLFPSMHIRTSLPESSPNCVCFSLRNNDAYTHQEIMDLVRNKSGFKIRSVRYDPVDVRAGSSEVPSRWIVEFECTEETHSFLQSGFVMLGEKIIVKLLDDVYRLEFEAYKLKLEEQRKLAERENTVFVSRKSRRNKTKKNDRSRF